MYPLSASRYGQPRQGYVNIQPLTANQTRSWPDCVLEGSVEGMEGFIAFLPAGTLLPLVLNHPLSTALYHL